MTKSARHLRELSRAQRNVRDVDVGSDLILRLVESIRSDNICAK